MRLIDADALRKKVINKCEVWKRWIIDEINNAPTIEPKGKWIPVNDRLPNLFEVVLVTDECGNVFEYERRSLDDDGNVCDEWCFLGRKIVAWMPLPEPYKKGGADMRKEDPMAAAFILG